MQTAEGSAHQEKPQGLPDSGWSSWPGVRSPLRLTSARMSRTPSVNTTHTPPLKGEGQGQRPQPHLHIPVKKKEQDPARKTGRDMGKSSARHCPGLGARPTEVERYIQVLIDPGEDWISQWWEGDLCRINCSQCGGSS